MKEIGSLLRDRIKQSGYTIYGISKVSGINRSTLQKVLLENRKPSTQFIDQIIPLLKLSPEERTELLTTVEYMNSEKTLYNQRIYIKQMLEHVADVLYGNSVHSVRMPNKELPSPPYENNQIFHSGFAVEKAINELIEYESYQNDPQIRINIPGSTALISNILMHTLYYCINFSLLNIQHIIYLTKLGSDQTQAMDNLEILGNIVPFICASDFQYQAGYGYHDSVHQAKHKLTAFPYFIAGSSWCILVSHDCTTAMYCSLTETVRHLTLLFEQEWKLTTPLSSTGSPPEDILPLLIHINQQDFPLITLEYQPCFPAYLTEEIIRSCAKSDIPNYERIVQQVLFRAMQIQSLSIHTSLFSKAGLTEFTETGRLSDFPPDYAANLSPNYRILLLEQLYDEIVQNKQTHRMINPVNFFISAYFSYFITKASGLVFLGYNTIRQKYDYMIIKEPSLIDAFYDFSQYLVGSSYVYSREDTLEFIKQCMNSLQ